MIGRPSRWPILSAPRELLLSNEIASGSLEACQVLLPLRAVVTATLGVMSINAPAAGIAPPSLITVCRNRTARSVRLLLGTVDRRASKELLPTRYVHVVFTLPSQLARLHYRTEVHLLPVAPGQCRKHFSKSLAIRAPRSEIWFLQRLAQLESEAQPHPHVHCVIPAGGLSLDHTHWVTSPNRSFFLSRCLSRVFRGKFVAALKQASRMAD